MIRLSRDPALYLTLIATAVRLLAAFVIDLTDSQQAVLNATATAVAGLIVALWVRRDGQVAAILGVAQALLALAVGFGLDAAFVRTQVTAPVSAEGARQA